MVYLFHIYNLFLNFSCLFKRDLRHFTSIWKRSEHSINKNQLGEKIDDCMNVSGLTGKLELPDMSHFVQILAYYIWYLSWELSINFSPTDSSGLI